MEYMPEFTGRQAECADILDKQQRDTFVTWVKENLPYQIKYQHMLDDDQRYRDVNAWIESTLRGTWAIVKVGIFSGVVYYFERNADRLLFKLKWGGSELGLSQEENDYVTNLLWGK